jgi:hypothetical protein
METGLDLDKMTSDVSELYQRDKAYTWPSNQLISNCTNLQIHHEGDELPPMATDPSGHISLNSVPLSAFSDLPPVGESHEELHEKSHYTRSITAAERPQRYNAAEVMSRNPRTTDVFSRDPGAPRRLGGSQRKTWIRKNAWGNQSYADLISKAIESSAEKRLTLAQIYDWIVQNVQYFSNKADSASSAGWKNSIRHNLSLHHSRFTRAINEGAGKSSWWMLCNESNPQQNIRPRADTVDSPRHKRLQHRTAPKGSGSTTSFQSMHPGDPLFNYAHIYKDEMMPMCPSNDPMSGNRELQNIHDSRSISAADRLEYDQEFLSGEFTKSMHANPTYQRQQYDVTNDNLPGHHDNMKYIVSLGQNYDDWLNHQNVFNRLTNAKFVDSLSDLVSSPFEKETDAAMYNKNTELGFQNSSMSINNSISGISRCQSCSGLYLLDPTSHSRDDLSSSMQRCSTCQVSGHST